MTTRLCALFGVLAVAGLLVGGLASPSGAGGDVTLTIEKVVSGPVPPGTTFTVDLNCEEDPDVGGTTMTFDAQGNPTPAGSNVVMYTSIPPGGFDCIPTEQQPAGATVLYACTASGVPDCGAAGPQSEPIVVNITGTGSATVTITNSFPEPTPTTTTLPQPLPAPAVVAPPTFTG